MISTTSKWKTYAQNSSVFHIKATMTGGSTVNLTDKDFMLETAKFTDSMSEMNEIKLGAVITNKFSATLNNHDGKFDNWDWNTITVQFGIIYDDNTEEWINRGTYTIDRPDVIGNTVLIECYDDCDKLNKTFYWDLVGSYTWDTYEEFIEAICDACGVTFGSWNCPTGLIDGVGTYLHNWLHDGEATCRQVISWVVESCSGYARMNPTTNQLECKAWSLAEWQDGVSYDGGVFDPWNNSTSADLYRTGEITPHYVFDPTTMSLIYMASMFVSGFMYVKSGTTYSMPVAPYNNTLFYFSAQNNNAFVNSFTVSNNSFTASANGYVRFNGTLSSGQNYHVYDQSAGSMTGGTTNPWNSVAGYNGGLMMVGGSSYELTKVKQQTIMADDVEVTGVRVYAYASADPQTYNRLFGSTGYVLNIEENPLVSWLTTSVVIGNRVSNQMNGFKVRPFNATLFGDPSLEAGDTVVLKDVRGNYHISIITNLTYTLCGDMQVSCEAQTEDERDINYAPPESVKYIRSHNLNIGESVTIKTTGEAKFSTSVTSAQFINDSLEEQKKGIEPLALSALEKIKDADILSYNYKREEDGDKKHIGLAVGEKYSVPEEVIAKDESGDPSGVDLYAMVSMAWKAIQELEDKVESLKGDKK